MLRYESFATSESYLPVVAVHAARNAPRVGGHAAPASGQNNTSYPVYVHSPCPLGRTHRPALTFPHSGPLSRFMSICPTRPGRTHRPALTFPYSGPLFWFMCIHPGARAERTVLLSCSRTPALFSGSCVFTPALGQNELRLPLSLLFGGVGIEAPLPGLYRAGTDGYSLHFPALRSYFPVHEHLPRSGRTNCGFLRPFSLGMAG